MEMIGLTVDYRGAEHTVYVDARRIDKIVNNDPSQKLFFYDYIMAAYDENGNRVMGIWKHGRTGAKRYTEAVTIDVRNNSIVEAREYHYGLIRPTLEYLCKVIWN